MHQAEDGAWLPDDDEELDFQARQEAQIAEITSPLNEIGAGEEFGHSPSPKELYEHYEHVGRPRTFACERGYEFICKKKKE